MRSRMKAAIAALAALVPTAGAQAVIVYGPNGMGGFNAYELVNPGSNYAGAVSGSQIAFPGGSGVPSSGTIGHLATFTGSADYEFIATVARPPTDNVFIGLSDDPTFAPGAVEDGNNSGNALPANGVIANPGTPALGDGERGSGWANVTGQPHLFHQRTPGVSIWGGGEPNDVGNEDAAEVRDDGFLNDIPTSAVRPYIREWDLNLTEAPAVGPSGGTGFVGVREVRNAGAPNSITGAENILNAQIGTITNGTAPYIHFIDPDEAGGGQFNNAGSANNSAALPFLTNQPGVGDNDIVQRTQGAIQITTPGIYTFGFDSDDGAKFELEGAVFTKTGGNGTASGDTILFEGQTGSSFTLASTFLAPGTYNFETTYFENGGGAFFELFAAQGTFTGFDANAFRIIGDTQFGGLALVTPATGVIPEPATAMLGIMGASLFALRRRRAA